MRVTRLEGLSRSRYKVYLDDSFAFVLYKGELRLYGIREEEELAEQEYRQIMDEVLPKRAALRCMNLLKSRHIRKTSFGASWKRDFIPRRALMQRSLM